MWIVEDNEFGVSKPLESVLIMADCDDPNSLVSDSATLTSLLQVRKLADTLVTIHIGVRVLSVTLQGRATIFCK